MTRRGVAGVLAGIAAALALGAAPARAHPMPHSVVLLDVHESAVTAELRLPAQDLELATGFDAGSAGRRGALTAYLSRHVRPGGGSWRVSVDDLAVSAAEQTATGPYREIVARLTLTPPGGAVPRRFALGYDVIVHRVVTHTARVAVRHDWAGGRISDDAEPVGTVEIDNRSMTVPDLTVDLGDASAWRGFAAMVRLGATHLLSGADHLLFLLVLLLPAPMLAAGGRWRGRAGTRTALRRAAAVTAAFTIGHSAVLAACALTRLDPPARPVEAFIAVGILIGAAHAVRPLFPSREAVVAGLFGLGHGLASAFPPAGLGLSSGRLALSLLGFTLGVGLVQLLLVALALPVALAVARLRSSARR